MINLFLDLDATIVDSSKAYCAVYNTYYSHLEGFKPADHTKVYQYNFSDECLLALQDKSKIFGNQDFFDNLILFENAYEVLLSLKDKYNITGISKSVQKKFNEVNILPLDIIDEIEVTKFLSLNKYDINSNGINSKSIVDMSGGIFIDDHQDNLFSSNAEYKYCYGEVKGWNDKWDGIRLENWLEIKECAL